MTRERDQLEPLPELTPELRSKGIEESRDILLGIAGAVRDRVQLTETEHGACEDCQQVRTRVRYGKFEICHACARLRLSRL